MKIGPGGGRVEAGSGKIAFPEGALAGEEGFGLREVPAPAGVPAAGAAFEIATDRALFGKPLSITLPARLPPGASPSRLHAVLSLGGVTERLRGGDYDAAAGTFTIRTDRLFLLSNGDTPDAGRPASAFPVVVAGVDPADLIVLPKENGIEFVILKSAEAKAQALLPGIKAALLKARTELSALKIDLPAEIHVGLRPLDPANGAHSYGGDSIEVNTESAAMSDPVFLEGAIVHEAVHLVQQQMKISNLRAAKVDVDMSSLLPAIGRWVDESTAEFMAWRICPTYAPYLVGRLRSDFGLRSLRTWNEPDAHEYQVGIFFCWLDTLYDGVELFRSIYTIHMTRAFIEIDPEADREGYRGTWDPLNVLDYVLRRTADRKGRKRALREAYSQFLLQLLWRKDFEPLASNRAAVVQTFGEPGEIRLPDPAGRIDWNLPEGAGNSRVTKQETKVFGESWQIVKVIQITNGSKEVPTDGEEMRISVRPEPRTPKNSTVLIVFPTRKATQEPVIGNPDHPVVIPDWGTCASATVWVVDVSKSGGWDLNVTAELRPGNEPAPPGALDLHLEPNMTFPKSTGDEFSFSMKLVSNPPPGHAELEKTEEGRNKLAEIERARYAPWHAALQSPQKWIHLEVKSGPVVHHLYGRAIDSSGPNMAFFSANLLLPRKAGDIELSATTTVMGKSLTWKTTVTVAAPESMHYPGDLKDSQARLVRARERARNAEKAKAEQDVLRRIREEIADLLERIGECQEWLWQDAEADAAWKEALDYAPPAQVKRLHKNLGWHALRCGRLEDHLEELKKCGQMPGRVEFSMRWLELRNDPEKARQYFKDLSGAGPAQEPNLMAPKPGEEILK